MNINYMSIDIQQHQITFSFEILGTENRNKPYLLVPAADPAVRFRYPCLGNGKHGITVGANFNAGSTETETGTLGAFSMQSLRGN